ncbi:NB-ARC domain-containing protein [Mycena sanguinolenta]|uniref:NB-ARC domain-containing protein n=1 Tax=Mycena sanguinolenta TaxID=230812 RepID=A0A8H6Y4P0_9AGAR|nr:NB-ARC domain-containing protein [Mycena sanguinolenta]
MICSVSTTHGVLPPSLVADIAKFTQTVRNLNTFVVSQEGKGKIKQFLKQFNSAARLKTCRDEMDQFVTLFRVQAGASAMSGVTQLGKNLDQQHEDLLSLLANYPDLTNSDCISKTDTDSNFSNKSETSLSMLPPRPQIFRGRESELEQALSTLQLDSPRLAILGMGGIGFRGRRSCGPNQNKCSSVRGQALDVAKANASLAMLDKN